jgi:hypothetical protein
MNKSIFCKWGLKSEIQGLKWQKGRNLPFYAVFGDFLGIYPLKKPYLGALTVTKAGRNTRSAMV